jgi:acyl-coenzyme A thioesterase PaaI-like protein
MSVSEPPVCLQERWAPTSICFGCGPANERGLRLRSLAAPDDPDLLLARWRGEKHHQAFEGMLNGGIVGALLDCHSNWAAAWHLMRRDALPRPPVTVTASFHVRLKRPTPSDRTLDLEARAVESEGAKVRVEATLTCEGEVTATCEGRFVAVEPGHPAYHGW